MDRSRSRSPPRGSPRRERGGRVRDAERPEGVSLLIRNLPVDTRRAVIRPPAAFLGVLSQCTLVGLLAAAAGALQALHCSAAAVALLRARRRRRRRGCRCCRSMACPPALCCSRQPHRGVPPGGRALCWACAAHAPKPHTTTRAGTPPTQPRPTSLPVPPSKGPRTCAACLRPTAPCATSTCPVTTTASEWTAGRSPPPAAPARAAAPGRPSQAALPWAPDAADPCSPIGGTSPRERPSRGRYHKRRRGLPLAERARPHCCARGGGWVRRARSRMAEATATASKGKPGQRQGVARGASQAPMATPALRSVTAGKAD
jgi:hypothetical protein